MALLPIATTACTVTASSGTASIVTPANTNFKIDDNGVYAGDLTVSVAGASDNTGCAGASGTATLSPTALNVKADNNAVVRATDNVSVTVKGTRPGSPPQACSFSVLVTITNAGQTSTKGD